MSLQSVADEVRAKLPQGVTLSSVVYVERYPARSSYQYESAPRVFAYQFFSTEGRNVATWIPDVSDTAQMQSGYGRTWGLPLPGEIEHVSVRS